MRFTRFLRFERVLMTARKESAFLRKQSRERSQYPLLAEQIAVQQRSVAEEEERRNKTVNSAETRLRAFHARVWREGRALYFAATAEQRERLQTHWRKWTGPTTSIYFKVMIEELVGITALRLAEIAARDRKIRDKVCREVTAQEALF